MRSSFLLVKPKDKADPGKKCGIVYCFTCSVCHNEYVGETERAMCIRCEEHLSHTKDKDSKIYKHLQQTCHQGGLDDFKILARNLDSYWPRKITEAIEIHKRNPSSNGDKDYPIRPNLLRLLPSQTHDVKRQQTQTSQCADESRLRRSQRPRSTKK